MGAVIDNLRFTPLPSHSDYAAFMKYNGFNDIIGGGNSGGRLTAPLYFAGAACMQIIKQKSICIGTHIASISKIDDLRFDPVCVTAGNLETVKAKDFPAISEEKTKEMQDTVLLAKSNSDSVGGTVECASL